MRAAVVWIFAVVLLAGGLFWYVSSQGDRPGRAGAKRGGTTSPLSAPRDGDSPLGPGENVWVKTFDRKTGDLASEFRADRYDPPQNGNVFVVKPQAKFYLSRGQLLTLTASTGKVVMPPGKRRPDGVESFQGAPPERGELQDVVVSLYDNDNDPEQGVAPTLTCTLPNITFDNDTLRLATAPITKDGQTIPADRVPVRVRGGQYDFDGYGLVIRWNQRDRHLEQLEIAHGERLTVKNVGALLEGKTQATAVDLRQRWSPVSVSAALAGQVAVAPAEPTTTTSTKKKKRPGTSDATRVAIAYRAVFNEGVTIREDGKPVGFADQLSAVFSFDEENESPATRPAKGKKPKRGIGPTLPTKHPATRPATLPADINEVVIEWTGKLVVLPIVLAESGLTSQRDRLVELFGSPVRLDRDGASVRAAVVRARGDQGFEAVGSDVLPNATFSDGAGMSLTSPSIKFDGGTGEAVISGVSRAIIPLPDEEEAGASTTRPASTQPTAVVSASWTDEARIVLAENSAGERAIKSATIRGGVSIGHPQLDLDANNLRLDFADRPNQDVALGTAVASGNVTAKLVGEDGKSQTLQTDTLTLATEPGSDGRVTVRGVTAEGNVVAFDEQQRLSARKLVAQLSGKPREAESAMRLVSGSKAKFDAGQLEKLVASGEVVFTSADGPMAAADTLTIEPAEPGQKLTLEGVSASVSDGKSVLRGLSIVIEPEAQRIRAGGAGTLESFVRLSPAAAPQAVTVAWTDGLDVDAANNLATLNGSVQADFTDADGTVQSAKGNKLILTLADAPEQSTSPATSATTRRGPADVSPATRPTGVPKVASGKIVRAVELRENVELSSILSDQQGKLLRRMHLFAPTLTVSADAQGELAAVTIPVGGRMLYDDQRAAEVKPQTVGNGPQAADAQGLESVRGATAVEWKKQMNYNPATRAVTLDGDVVVVHKDPGGEPLRLGSQQLVIKLAEPAPGAAAARERIDVASVTAGGGVSFTATKIRFDAAEFTLDPTAARVTAKGSDRQPVEVYDESGLSSGSFEEGVWNLNTRQLERLKNFAGKVRN